MSSLPYGVRRRSDPGGNLIRSYKLSSWLLLRLYGAGFLATAELMRRGVVDAAPMLAPFGLSAPTMQVALALGVLGVMLAVPFLTPSPLRFPKSVAGGLVKAVLMVVLSGVLYFAVEAVLAAELWRFSAKVNDVVPLAIKAVAGLSVTGAILVSLAMALTEGEAQAKSAPPPAADRDQLRALRKARSR